MKAQQQPKKASMPQMLIYSLKLRQTLNLQVEYYADKYLFKLSNWMDMWLP